jgi:hypothetical protein
MEKGFNLVYPTKSIERISDKTENMTFAHKQSMLTAMRVHSGAVLF